MLLHAWACARPQAPGPPPSVLLVTFDTLRADRVGVYGDAAARTPHLDRLAREGVRFERAYSAAPVTLPAHATLFTGLLPPEHGVRGNGSFALGSGPRTLAEALRGRGLRTAAFVGAFPVAQRFGLGRGFDRYDDAFSRAPGLHFDFAERRADRVVEAAESWLQANAGPVFVWVHLYDPHAPYDPPEGYGQGDRYRGEIAFADAMFGRLLAVWEARPGPAFVAATSDHGEAFGERGEESHGLFVYDTTLRVPLLLRGPGLPAGRRVAEAVGLVDLPATLCELAGAGAFPGRSLSELWSKQAAAGESAQARGPLYAETLAPRLDFGWSELRAWRDGRFKYVRAPRPELFDLEDDPQELRNLASSKPEQLAGMEQALAAKLERMGEAQSRSPIDVEAAERLRSLGYVQGPGGAGSGADPKDRTEVARRIAAATGPFRGPEDVVAIYRELAALDPGNPLVDFRLADALLRAGRPREAIPVFRRVTGAGARTADPFVGLATAYAQADQLDEARAALEQALRVDPASAQAHFNLGELARARGDADRARTHYEAALSDPVTRERAQARLAERAGSEAKKP